jgi:hypothetical protein
MQVSCFDGYIGTARGSAWGVVKRGDGGAAWRAKLNQDSEQA